jgi:amidohydrolase
MAALVAVVGALRAAGAPVPLVAVLQPREEAVPSGAADMVAAAELLDQDVRAMVGVHVQPRIPERTYSAVPGAVNASSDDFVIVLSSHGGHAGYPHVSGDPVVAAASLVVALQSVVARQIDPLHPAVVTVGSIRAGEAPNVIPDRATLEGTIRAFEPTDRALLRERVRQAAEQAAALHGCTLDLALHAGEPPLVNDPALAGLAGRWIDAMTGRKGVDLRSCGSDDFSYYGTKFPSVMVFYGLGDARPESPGLHHPRFAPSDDDVGGVAECLLAGYFAACELILGPPEES